MANDDTTPGGAPASTESSSFLSSGAWAKAASDSTYSDFFQETSDWNISIGRKAQKSGLEMTTTVLGYIVPVVILVVLFWAFHVFIRGGGGATSINEKYNFLCPYLNYGIDVLTTEEKNCQTLKVITQTFEKKNEDLQTKIVNKLAEYIPIKITKNLLITSPERTFVIDTYKNKLHMDLIMNQFEEVRKMGKSVVGDNIICSGISITENGALTTQCTIYWGPSGADDENGKLGSARVEALRFSDVLGDTSQSRFIFLNPPTSLSMETLGDKTDPNFQTRTTLSIQAEYVPFTDKP